MNGIYDVIVIGVGPAGSTAGLYTSRAKLRTLAIEKETAGGELVSRDMIENYPGYPDGISGPELASNMVTQMMNHGAEIQMGEVTRIKIEGDHKAVQTSEGEYLSKALIIAGGARPRKLGVPGEQEFANRGVFYCATCDGALFADKVVAVAGGGDSALTEAIFLARLVSKVVVIQRSPHLRAGHILRERVSGSPKIEVRCGVTVEAIVGDERVKAINLLDTQTGEKSFLPVDGVLVRAGTVPNTDYLRGSVPLNNNGQILVNAQMETEIAGIFAAGDIRHGSPMQIATAVGDGATAALSLEKYLRSLCS